MGREGGAGVEEGAAASPFRVVCCRRCERRLPAEVDDGGVGAALSGRRWRVLEIPTRLVTWAAVAVALPAGGGVGRAATGETDPEGTPEQQRREWIDA